MDDVLQTQLVHVKWDEVYRADVLNGNCIDIYEKAYKWEVTVNAKSKSKL